MDLGFGIEIAEAGPDGSFREGADSAMGEGGTVKARAGANLVNLIQKVAYLCRVPSFHTKRNHGGLSLGIPGPINYQLGNLF